MWGSFAIAQLQVSPLTTPAENTTLPSPSHNDATLGLRHTRLSWWLASCIALPQAQTFPCEPSPAFHKDLLLLCSAHWIHTMSSRKLKVGGIDRHGSHQKLKTPRISVFLWPPMRCTYSFLPHRFAHQGHSTSVPSSLGCCSSTRLPRSPMCLLRGPGQVLCLHGYRQNADTFRAKTGNFRKKLKSHCTFGVSRKPALIVLARMARLPTALLWLSWLTPSPKTQSPPRFLCNTDAGFRGDGRVCDGTVRPGRTPG